MELAMVGLGRMGLNMCKRLLRESHTVHAFARSASSIAEAVAAGAGGGLRPPDLPKIPPPPLLLGLVAPGKNTPPGLRPLTRVVGRGGNIIYGGHSLCQEFHQ